MLVLSRKKGESIVIGDSIELTVLAVDGDTVRIGIKAPQEVNVHRKEVYLSIQESNLEAASKLDKQELLADLLKIYGGKI